MSSAERIRELLDMLQRGERYNDMREERARLVAALQVAVDHHELIADGSSAQFATNMSQDALAAIEKALRGEK